MQWLRNLWIWIFRWFGFTKLSKATDFSTLPFDGIRWDYPNPAKDIYAIGDVHGDLTKLASIIHQVGLIDDSGKWVGAQSHLVLVGDLVGGNSDSRLLVEYMMHLEREAAHAGGAVHCLLGNHDLIPAQANTTKMSPKEKALYRDYAIPGATSRKVKDSFRKSSVFADWLQSRNAILKLGNILFVHAGLDEWALETEPGAINATVRAWVRYWQDNGPRPERSTQWTVGKREMKRGSRWETGPLWNRSYKTNRKGERTFRGMSKKQLTAALERWQVDYCVVGHAPVASGKIELSHPHYGERIVMIDTRIGDANEGSLSVLEIKGQQLTPRYVKTTKVGAVVRDLAFEKLKQVSARPPIRGRPSKLSDVLREIGRWLKIR